jgi:hypothetical protein
MVPSKNFIVYCCETAVKLLTEPGSKALGPFWFRRLGRINKDGAEFENKPEK